MLNSQIKGQPAVCGGRRPGDAISRGVLAYYTWYSRFVNTHASAIFEQKMARLTKELEAQFEESEKLEKHIQQNLKRFDNGK